MLTAATDDRHLFVNRRGVGLTRQGLYKIVQRHARSVGLEDRMSLDTLRHTFATHLLAGGAICARCRRCSATPTSPRPRSTPTSRAERLKDVYFSAHPRAAGRRGGRMNVHADTTACRWSVHASPSFPRP